MGKMRFAVAVLLSAGLVACGGGGGGGSSSRAATGVAAVGAPISLGTLSAIDAGGRTASTTIAADGTYTLDFLSNLQAPVLLRAEGVSGGRTVIHFGVVTNIGQTTVNVTPVSTAVVAQVMQADPGAVFASADTAKIALLTTAQVSATNATIGNAISAARSAAGLTGSGSLDFLSTPFSADKTGLDKVLDLVRVSVQPDRTVQLKNKTADGVTTVAANGSVNGSLGSIQSIDTKLIDALGQALQASFEDGQQRWLASAQSVLDLFSTSFLHGGLNRNQMIASIALDAEEMRGAEFLPANVLNCSATGALPTCDALFTVRYPDDAVEVFTLPLRFENGSWKLYGDQSPTSTQYESVVVRTVSNSSSTTKSGFAIRVPDDAMIGPVDVGYIKIWFGTDTSGPPERTFVNPTVVSGSCGGNSLGGFLRILNSNNSCDDDFVELSDERIGQLRLAFATVRPKITVHYFDASGNRIANAQHVITVESLPLKPSEVSDAHFAAVSNASWTQFLSAGVGGAFTLSVTKGSSVGLEDVIGARPLGTTNSVQRLPYSTVRTGSSWNVLRANLSLTTVTRDADGRMYRYVRQP